MSYREEWNQFTEKYPYQSTTVGGARFRYVLTGKPGGVSLVFLNGGMNTSEMWMRYADELSANYQVLLFDYPQELKTNQELVTGMDALFRKLELHKPILVGASDGGMVAQIYTQKYPHKVGGLILISTGGMDAVTINSFKRRYFFAPLMLLYMKHCNYEKLKPALLKSCLHHARQESPADQAYARDMFTAIFEDYTKEKDVHITGLLIDLMRQTPVTKENFSGLKGKIMLILPDKDWFSGKKQKSLIELMHEPEIHEIQGGHLSTVLRAEEYITKIKLFLSHIRQGERNKEVSE